MKGLHKIFQQCCKGWSWHYQCKIIFFWKNQLNSWDILDDLTAIVLLCTSGRLSLVYPLMVVSFSVSRKAKQVAHSCITHCCFCFHSKFGHPELSGSEFCSVAPCLLKTWIYLYFFHKCETSDTQHAFMCYEDSKCVFFLCVPFTEKPQNYKT